MKNLNYEGLQTYERHKTHLMMSQITSDHFFGHLATITSIFMNQH